MGWDCFPCSPVDWGYLSVARPACVGRLSGGCSAGFPAGAVLDQDCPGFGGFPCLVPCHPHGDFHGFCLLRLPGHRCSGRHRDPVRVFRFPGPGLAFHHHVLVRVFRCPGRHRGLGLAFHHRVPGVPCRCPCHHRGPGLAFRRRGPVRLHRVVSFFVNAFQGCGG